MVAAALDDGSYGAVSVADDDSVLPPYAVLSVPVYSLATAPGGLGEGDRASMNITTYCCPVTIKPSRRMAVALYTNTATARNMIASRKGVLQVLRAQHAPLVPLLGETSACDVDKLAELATRGVATVKRYGVHTLADAAGVIALEIVSIENAGDHHLALCDVVGYETLEGKGEPLYTADLASFKGKKNTGGEVKAGNKAPKHLDEPKRPLSSYLLFAAETRGMIRQENPGLSPTEVIKALGVRWQAISPEDKAVFVQKAKEAKVTYDKVMAKLYPTPPAPPKRPPSSYLIFTAETRGKVLEENPGLKMLQVSQLLATRWKKLSLEDKAVFVEKAKEAKTRHLKAMEQYKLDNL